MLEVKCKQIRCELSLTHATFLLLEICASAEFFALKKVPGGSEKQANFQFGE